MKNIIFILLFPLFCNTNILKLMSTVSGAGASSNDFIGKFGTIKWYPVAAN